MSEEHSAEKDAREVMDLRDPGETFCSDCPDHEGCMTGYPCSLVKRVNRVTPPDECSHGEPEGECPSCAACAACRGECGVCPYVTPPGGVQ